MRDNFYHYHEFIVEQRSFLEDALLPEVNDGVNESEQLSWDANNWQYGGMSKGFLSGAIHQLCFCSIKTRSMKGLFDKDEDWNSQVIEVEDTYSEFMKAYCVSLHRTSSPSGMVVLSQQLILKRVYVRMLMAGVEPHPVNITSEFLQQAVDLLASSRTGLSASSNAAKDYDDASVIARNLNYLGFTSTQIEVVKKRKAISQSASTKASKKAKIKESGEDLDDEEHEKNLTIQTFLNIVALRSMVQHDGEKIVLNLVLLLMVTGFRHMEAANIRYKSFKVVEIENETTRRLMEKRGLPTIFVGILYLGEKGAGYRTHWIEPLAVELVEDILVDTLILTENLRSQLEHIRKINFSSYLPKKFFYQATAHNAANRQLTMIDLDEIVDDVYESYSKTAFKRGRSGARDSASKKILNSKLGIEPVHEENLGQNNKKRVLYNLDDIEKFIRNSALKDILISNDFKQRIKNSATNTTEIIPYEDLLFIIPQGSGAVSRSGAMKCVPQIIDKTTIAPFLGYGQKGNRGRSIFAKYGLTEEDGEFTLMYSHTPRHGINTFFAITGISEHLQAMFMGRRDFTQNEKYQHLAIQEKALSTALVASGNCEMLLKENSAVESIKNKGNIGINTNLSLKNSLTQTMHTYTTVDDRVSFVLDVVSHSDSDAFSEFDELFNLVDEVEKQQVVKPHSDLAVMNIGSCMRKLSTFQCPYNMKCQDGSPCPYFTLTGREDEFHKIEKLAARVDSQIAVINQMEIEGKLDIAEVDEILEDLNLRRINIRYYLGQSEIFESEKTPINLLELDYMKKPKMLSSIFALEQRKIEKKKIRKSL